MSSLGRGSGRRAIAGLLVSAALISFQAIPGRSAGRQPALVRLALIGRAHCGAVLVSPFPFGTGSCPGIRPGGAVQTDIAGCTLGFLFAGTNGQRYIGTAGHCVLLEEGESVWAFREGPIAFDREGRRFGRFVYAVLLDQDDFALIQLKRAVKSRSEMCHFGGPMGVNNERTAEPVVLHYYGNGEGVGFIPVLDQPLLPARSAVAPGMRDRRAVSAEGIASFGDSGSGVISSDGRAVGTLVAVGVPGLLITRFVHQVIRAEGALDIGLRLVRADLQS